MFVRLPGLKIRAEVRMRVHHCLLGRGEWGQVRRVYSKAQALSQCRHWLGKNLPQATVHPLVSSAAPPSWRNARSSPRPSPAGPREKRSGSRSWPANIEDQSHNLTRFAVIAERTEGRPVAIRRR
jgi:chorismate mutase/prephenate dehydratase